MSLKTVQPIGVVTLGAPQRCPTCGGQLAPCFGVIEEDNIRRPYLDPTHAQCVDCGEMFAVAESSRK